MIALTFVQWTSSVFDIITFLSLIAIGVIVTKMMSRQRKDLADGARLMRAMAHYASVQEEDGRSLRHAVKNLVGVIGLQKEADAMFNDAHAEAMTSAIERITRLVEVHSDESEVA